MFFGVTELQTLVFEDQIGAIVMRILVTGGAGFIGSNFIGHMLEHHPEDEITNLDLLTYAGNPETLKRFETSAHYQFVRGDITHPGEVARVMDMGVDVIVNFAAESHVDRSVLDPSSFVRTNIVGTQVLLDAARDYSIAKFVQVSTDEVYGTLSANDPLFSESTPLAPNSPYSASKASSDLLVRAYRETYGIPTSITRCSNNYGPYQFPEKLVPLMIINALEGKPLPIYGDGLQVRDWLHVRDHCAAIDLVARYGKDGEVYNIGGNNERTNLSVARTVLSLLDMPESLIRHVDDRPGHDRRYAIDSTKIQRELGWSPKYTFDSGILDTINWYLGNRDWWSAVRSGEYLDFYERQYRERLEDAP